MYIFLILVPCLNIVILDFQDYKTDKRIQNMQNNYEKRVQHHNGGVFSAVLESERLTCAAEEEDVLLDQRGRRASVREALYVNTCCPSRPPSAPSANQVTRLWTLTNPQYSALPPTPSSTNHSVQTDFLWMSRLRGLKLVPPQSAQLGQIRERGRET